MKKELLVRLCIFLGILSILSLQAESVAPDPPTNVTADGSWGRVVLSWVKSVGTVYCSIYCNGGEADWDEAKYTYVDPDASFTDYDVTVGQVYQYRVSAGNSSYEESQLSLPAVSVTVYEGSSDRQTTPTWDPAEPLEETNGAIVIKWSAAGDAQDGTTYYSISRANSPNAWSTKYQYIYETEHTDTDIEPNITYYYRLKATSPDMASNATSAQSITTSGSAGYFPKPPENLTATPGNYQVELSWDESETSGVTYSIYRTTQGDAWSSTAIYSAIYQTSFTDTSVQNSTTYYYRVTAVDEDGESSPASSLAVTPGGSGTPVGSGTQPVDYPSSNPSVGTDCFIATAAYGSVLQEEVRVLSEFRDRYLLRNRAGQVLVKLYYRLSPPVAEIISKNRFLRTVIRMMLKPLIRLTVLMVEK